MAKNYVEKFHLRALVERACLYFNGGKTVSETAGRAYMEEIIARAKNCDVFPFPCGDAAAFSAALLCGARTWSRASEGGCFLVSNEEISQRAGIDFTDCEGSEAIEWQGKALRAAARALTDAYVAMRSAHRQFYVVSQHIRTRRAGGAVYSFTVYEYAACDPRDTPSMRPVASGRYCTAGFKGEKHEAWSALCRAGEISALVHKGRTDYFPSEELGESAERGAYCTIEQLN